MEWTLAHRFRYWSKRLREKSHQYDSVSPLWKRPKLTTDCSTSFWKGLISRHTCTLRFNPDRIEFSNACDVTGIRPRVTLSESSGSQQADSCLGSVRM